jgi:hypothetical protein
MREIRPSGDRRKGPLSNSGTALRRQPRSCLWMCCRGLESAAVRLLCYSIYVSSLGSRRRRLPIGSLLLQPSDGTHPQRHSILEVLRRESVRWFLSRRGQSCSSRKQSLDLFQNRQQPTINSSIFHQWTQHREIGSGDAWVVKQWIIWRRFTAKLFSKQLFLLSDDFGGLMIDWNDLLSLADLVRAFPASSTGLSLVDL